MITSVAETNVDVGQELQVIIIQADGLVVKIAMEKKRQR